MRKLTEFSLYDQSTPTVLLLSNAVICQIIFCTIFKNSCNCRCFCLGFFTFKYTFFTVETFQNWHLAYLKKEKKKRRGFSYYNRPYFPRSVIDIFFSFLMWVYNQVVPSLKTVFSFPRKYKNFIQDVEEWPVPVIQMISQCVWFDSFKVSL